MKVQVKIINAVQPGNDEQVLTVNVSPNDTGLTLQERIEEATNTFAFPEKQLLLNGQTIASTQRVTASGIADGTTLQYVFKASEESLCKQLSDLLGEKAMAMEELGFLFSYRYAMSVEDALKAVGCSRGKLSGFLESQKCFRVQGDRVQKLCTTDKPQECCADSMQRAPDFLKVRISTEVHIEGKAAEMLSSDIEDDDMIRLESSATVAKCKDIIAGLEQMPFPDRKLRLGDRILPDDITLEEAGVKNNFSLSLVVNASESSLADQLAEVVMKLECTSASELGLLYCQRHGTPVGQALRILGLHSNLRVFLEKHPRFHIDGGCVKLASSI